MFFNKDGIVSTKTRSSDRVATWSLVGTIKCKIVYGLGNTPGFDNAPNFDKYRVFTRDGTINPHDKIVIDQEVYIVDSMAKHSWINAEYYVYFVTKSNGGQS